MFWQLHKWKTMELYGDDKRSAHLYRSKTSSELYDENKSLSPSLFLSLSLSRCVYVDSWNTFRNCRSLSCEFDVLPTKHESRSEKKPLSPLLSKANWTEASISWWWYLTKATIIRVWIWIVCNCDLIDIFFSCYLLRWHLFLTFQPVRIERNYHNAKATIWTFFHLMPSIPLCEWLPSVCTCVCLCLSAYRSNYFRRL